MLISCWDYYNASFVLFPEAQIWVILNLMVPEAGFSEREHTADWELEVWAPDFPSLLEQAALGFVAITSTTLKEEARQSRTLILSAGDRESLLVKFLQELLILSEQERLGFDQFQFIQKGDSLKVHMKGAPIQTQDKEIKAVTYHNLSVRETAEGLQVNIVFDV